MTTNETSQLSGFRNSRFIPQIEKKNTFFKYIYISIDIETAFFVLFYNVYVLNYYPQLIVIKRLDLTRTIGCNMIAPNTFLPFTSKSNYSHIKIYAYKSNNLKFVIIIT